jgi:hypothetical protein
MSFLFGKKSKQQGNALPPASRGLTSSDGREPPQPASLNGPPGGKDSGRPGPQPQTANSTPSGSVNNSLSSLQGRDGQPIAPEPKALRERAGSNEQVGRNCFFRRSTQVLTMCDRVLYSKPGLKAVLPKIPHTRGPLDASISPPATRFHATAPQSTRSPPKMALSTLWEVSLAAQQLRAISG